MRTMSLRDGLNENIKNLHRGAFAHSDPNIVQLFRHGGQPMSLKDHVGLIQGPGTGKSDSIDAKLPAKGFVLPVEVVQAIGPDKLQAMIDQFSQDSPRMMKEEVPAKVSNGEFFVPPEVVAKTGPEYWDSLVQQVTGSPAQPEISREGVKAADGYGPNLADERQAAQQFWSQPNRTVQPTPGRANPANPSELMQDRMATSAVNSQAQAQGLRSQINQNLTNPVQAPIQPTVQPASLNAPAQQTVQPARQPAVSYFNTPKTPTLKDQLLGVGNDLALATSLASDVLQAPQIAQNRDAAISGLKAKAGFKETDTPFRYNKGGYVVKAAGGYSPNVADPEEERRRNALPPSVKSAVQGVDNVLNDIVDRRNQLREATQTNREAGYGLISGYAKAGSDVNASTLNAVKNIPASIGEGIASGYNALFGTPQDTQVNTPPKNNDLKAAVFNPEQDKPKVTPTKTPATTSLKEAVKTLPADPETGFRYDGAPQTLDWNESRWSNSGDAEQDSALSDRQAARSAMRDQVSLTQPEVQSEFTKTKDGASRSSRFGGVKPDYPTTGGQSALGLAKLAQDQEQFDKIYTLKQQEARKDMPEELGDDAYSAIDDIKKGDHTGTIYLMQKYPKTLKVLRETYPDLFANFGLTNG